MSGRPSAEQRLMMLADAARRADLSIATLAAGAPRASVPRAVWDALTALIALAIESDVEGR